MPATARGVARKDMARQFEEDGAGEERRGVDGV